MKIETKYLIVVAISLLLAFPVAVAMQRQHHREEQQRLEQLHNLEQLEQKTIEQESQIEELKGQLEAKAEQKRQSLLAKAVNAVTHTQPAYADSPNGIPSILLRIRGCESGSGPNSPGSYTAQNPTSTASGAYQFLDSTWGNYKGYAKARYAPRDIQDERAIIEYNRNGTNPWVQSQHCWG